MEQMQRNSSRKRRIAGAAAILIAAGLAGFFTGQSLKNAEYKKEQELNIQLNRSELEGLGEISGTIYVTGHKSPDSDTVGSSIGYAYLLRELGYDAVPVVLGKINNETEYILRTAGLETPELLVDASGKNMILVDHSEYTHSADGLEDSHIISIIDHHGDGEVTTGHQLIYDARPLGATATIVWIRYRNYGLEPDKKTAAAMMGAILSDTSNLKAAATTFADRKAVEDLGRLAGISDIDAFYQEMYEASLSYEGMTDGEILHSDYKEYVCGGTKYAIGIVKMYDEDGVREMAERMKNIMPSELVSTGMDMIFVEIVIFRDDLSVCYLVPSDEAAAEVIETAFGDAVVFDGMSYRMEPSVSRKKVLVPAFTDVLEAHPKE